MLNDFNVQAFSNIEKYFVVFYLSMISNKNFVVCNAVNFNERIAGGRSISECINGHVPTVTNSDPKMYITTSEFAREMGYAAEEHTVEADDGYILTLHRILDREGAPPVFLQHGLLGSSFDWVVSGKDKSLALKLVDEGYDVWLGNVRGNTYSRCHTKYKTSSYEFWDSSWHKMGIYDLPAMITHVTETTGQKIIYIGHSMGTTAFFVMAIERPDIALQVKLMMALAPVAFINHATSPLQVLAPFTRQMEFFVKARGNAEILSQSPTLKRVLEYACTLSTVQRRVCTSVAFFATGFNSRQFNYSLVPEILYHVPAGSSLKIFIHYYQEYNSGRFRYYDYGAERNLKLYKDSQPPDYNISKITVPVGLFWSDSDAFANPVDVERLYKQLPNVILNYQIDHAKFHHLDYLYAIDAPKYVYEKRTSFMNNYR